MTALAQAVALDPARVECPACGADVLVVSLTGAVVALDLPELEEVLLHGTVAVAEDGRARRLPRTGAPKRRAGEALHAKHGCR
jgi:hypothetical protein